MLFSGRSCSGVQQADLSRKCPWACYSCAPTWASPSQLCHRLHSRDPPIQASAAPRAGHLASSQAGTRSPTYARLPLWLYLHGRSAQLGRGGRDKAMLLTKAGRGSCRVAPGKYQCLAAKAAGCPTFGLGRCSLFSSSAIQHIKQLPEQQTAPPERLGRWGQGLARTQQLLGKQLAQVRPLLASQGFSCRSHVGWPGELCPGTSHAKPCHALSLGMKRSQPLDAVNPCTAQQSPAWWQSGPTSAVQF